MSKSMPNTAAKHLHVAAGVIFNEQGQILLSKRHIKQDQGGLWEFPGGKLHGNETPFEALTRELNEELAIDVRTARPMIKVNHDYPDYSVLLDVWKINEYSGIAHGREGQEITWVFLEELSQYKFPEANYPIITSVNLPSVYFITPEPSSCENEETFLSRIEKVLSFGCKLIQFRSKTVPISESLDLISKIYQHCLNHNARLLINSYPEILNTSNVDGVHLSSQMLMQQKDRPIPEDKLLSVSCHNEKELDNAISMSADIILLGSVMESTSHPGVRGMGWQRFSNSVEQVNIPVYALGGMKLSDINTSWQQGAQGIALISDLWERTQGLEKIVIPD